MRISALFLAPLLFLFACGGGSSINAPSNNGGGGSASVPQFQHVAIVVLENASYSDVIGNANMPYLNGLASQGALLQNYYANAHPSIPNYFMLTAGQPETFDDSFTGTVSDDNLVRDFIAAGLTWKEYAESIPSVGYTGPNSGLYIERHDPLSYFSDVRNSSTQTANLVPFSQLATDMGGNSLPNFLWISPNALDSAHSCPSSNSNCTLDSRLATADSWLSANIAPLLSSPSFSNGLLIVVFDESESLDVQNGGGHVACILAGAHVKTGYKSTAQYQHQDTLSLIGHALKLSSVPGAGATGGTMTEFFQ